MPLNIKNIDKEVNLPEGIHFRKELIWAKVQNQRKIKVFWAKVVAAVAFIGFGLSFLAYQSLRPDQEIREIGDSNMVIDDRGMPQNSSRTAQTSPLIQEISPLPFNEKKQVQEETSVKKENYSEISDFQVPPVLLANSIRMAAVDSMTEPLDVEKSLSPAASRLQKSIQKMNPNLASQQSVVVERFDLIKIIQSQPLQASSNSSTNSGLNSLFHGKIQQN